MANVNTYKRCPKCKGKVKFCCLKIKYYCWECEKYYSLDELVTYVKRCELCGKNEFIEDNKNLVMEKFYCKECENKLRE